MWDATRWADACDQDEQLAAKPLCLCKFAQDAPLQEAAQEIRSIRSSLGWRDCNCATVLLPKHTDEVADIVLALYRDQQASGQKYLIRATSQEFTSQNDLSCACESNPADVRPIVMDMSAMDKILEFNDEQETITVQTGITFEASLRCCGHGFCEDLHLRLVLYHMWTLPGRMPYFCSGISSA